MAKKPIDIYTYYIPPEITIGQKQEKFYCTTCNKPYYEDRKKLAKHMGCQCQVPTEPVAKPTVEKPKEQDWDWYC